MNKALNKSQTRIKKKKKKQEQRRTGYMRTTHALDENTGYTRTKAQVTRTRTVLTKTEGTLENWFDVCLRA